MARHKISIRRYNHKGSEVALYEGSAAVKEAERILLEARNTGHLLVDEDAAAILQTWEDIRAVLDEHTIAIMHPIAGG